MKPKNNEPKEERERKNTVWFGQNSGERKTEEQFSIETPSFFLSLSPSLSSP